MGRTNIYIEDKLVTDGLRLTGCKSKRELVDQALRDLVRRKKQREILRYAGKISWNGNLTKSRERRVFR